MIQIYKGSIYSFKLLSGEEFIAEVSEVGLTSYDISNPLGVSLTPQGPDTFPAMIAGNMNRTMQLNISAIALIGEVEEHIQQSYKKGIEELHNENSKQILTE